jgi:hypothetical protein
MKPKIILSGLLCALSLYGDGSSNALDYYKDGIYDTTTLINKYLKEGLQETVLDQYYEKYLVLANLDQSSYVDTIFFQNVAEKGQIQSVKIAKRLSDNKSFMVFGSFERKADADMIQQKLMSSGIETAVILNKEPKNGYVVNPIIIKKYLGEIRELIKDMPIKVIKIEKTYAKDGSECQVPTLAAPKKPLAEDTIFIDREFREIAENWVNNGEVDCPKADLIAFRKTSKLLSGKKNYYSIGEKIGCFTLKNIIHSAETKKDSIVLTGPDGVDRTAVKFATPCAVMKKRKYQKVITPKKHLQTKRRCADGIESDFCPEDGSKKASPLDMVAGTSNTSGTQCDFSNITLAKLNGSALKVSKTPYSGKNINVKVLSKKDGYVDVKAASLPIISISESSFSEQCK